MVKFSNLFILIFLLFINCDDKKERLITNKSIGDYNFCTNLSREFSSTSKVVEYQHNEYEQEWKEKKYYLENEEWISFEVRHNNEIFRISTNSTKFKTSKGYKIGTTIQSILNDNQEIDISLELGQISFRFLIEDIHFETNLNISHSDIEESLANIGVRKTIKKYFSNDRISLFTIIGSCKK